MRKQYWNYRVSVEASGEVQGAQIGTQSWSCHQKSFRHRWGSWEVRSVVLSVLKPHPHDGSRAPHKLLWVIVSRPSCLKKTPKMAVLSSSAHLWVISPVFFFFLVLWDSFPCVIWNISFSFFMMAHFYPFQILIGLRKILEWLIFHRFHMIEVLFKSKEQC